MELIVIAVLLALLSVSTLAPAFYFATQERIQKKSALRDYVKGVALWAVIIALISFVCWLKQ
jgi:hypothetical protein